MRIGITISWWGRVCVEAEKLAFSGRDTRLELDFRAALRSKGHRGYRVNYRVDHTRVDDAYPRKRLAILIHGCFSHQCPICSLPLPKSPTEFWKRKFSLNKIRDERVRLSLQARGWKVTEFWEHEIREP